MNKLPKIALGAWAWGNDGTFGNALGEKELKPVFEGNENVPLLGVSNHNLAEIKQADEILKSHGLRLSAVQNHYSLINRSSEESGILDYCKDNDIYFFSYTVYPCLVIVGGSLR